MKSLIVLLLVSSTSSPRPSLELKGPPFVMVSDYSGNYPKGIVELRARIKGKINEEWYCPRLVWVWPDGTKSSSESDCEPYSEEEAKHAPYIWTKVVAVPEGEWTFAVEAWKGDKKLATAYWTVRVGSPNQDNFGRRW